MQSVTTNQSAPAIAASLMYGLLLQPLSAAFGDFGSLMTSELEKIPLRNSRDPLCLQFERIFQQGGEHHG